ncbi:MAG TPA: hypothetical protein VLD67_07470, partial [Vicinamibacterales bacterium]|nr:hypothetical protein [Vicinamibacterales bacterium]
ADIDRMDAMLRELSTDPRVNLKPGFQDAGEAAVNVERVATLPKPAGFFDPKAPAGLPDPPEEDEDDAKKKEKDDAEEPRSGILDFANTDLAFAQDMVIEGNYHGFNSYNIEDPMTPQLLASVVCPGGQGDVSIYKNLLFMSVEQTRGRLDCGLQGVAEPKSKERFRGIRIFDITDIRMPKQVAAVQTCRGSHTHTLVNDPDDKGNLYVYNSGTGRVRPSEELAECSDANPAADSNTALFSIDVIQVPLARPEEARIVNRARIFADPETGAVAGLWRGGDHGPGTQKTSETNMCHDITVYPELGLAAGACSGNGILIDISDPANPVRIDQVVDPTFAYWHSATFNNDGTKVIFTDEWGGGGGPKCRANDKPEWGANAIFAVENGRLVFKSYYKMPAAQTAQENCVAHNGSLIPIPGREVMVQGWYQGGISVFDWTDVSKPTEIAFFDRGPIDGTRLITGGSWSVYWYNGLIISSEIARGLDILELLPSGLVSQNEIDAARTVVFDQMNAQEQRRFVWPPSFALARAYVDQLERSSGLASARLAAIRTDLSAAERLSGAERQAALTRLAGQIAQDTPTAADAAKTRTLATAVSQLATAR